MCGDAGSGDFSPFPLVGSSPELCRAVTNLTFSLAFGTALNLARRMHGPASSLSLKEATVNESILLVVAVMFAAKAVCAAVVAIAELSRSRTPGRREIVPGSGASAWNVSTVEEPSQGG